MIEVGFGFGSNVGDKIANIETAMTELEASGLVHTVQRSSMYRTAPWGDLDQDWFINACAVGRSQASAQQLLQCCQNIERGMGRLRTRRWGPRNIDVDILFYDDQRVEQADLRLPHPELLHRPFVLVPLLEIRPKLVLFGVKLIDALASLERGDVQLYSRPA
jgi:2-amino-4-hydroxy-6-hydroxymethyldihydropteridine diphosphokinase